MRDLGMWKEELNDKFAMGLRTILKLAIMAKFCSYVFQKNIRHSNNDIKNLNPADSLDNQLVNPENKW